MQVAESRCQLPNATNGTKRACLFRTVCRGVRHHLPAIFKDRWRKPYKHQELGDDEASPSMNGSGVCNQLRKQTALLSFVATLQMVQAGGKDVAGPGESKSSQSNIYI